MREVADIRRKTPKNIRNCIYWGDLKGYKILGSLYVVTSDIVEFLEIECKVFDK